MSHLSAMVKLAEVIVGAGGQATIQFSNIPQTYRGLQLLLDARGDVAGASTQTQIQFNGDTASNYDWVSVYTNGTPGGQNAAGVTSIRCAEMCAATGPTNVSDSAVIFLPNYAGTMFQKTLKTQEGVKSANSAGSFYGALINGWWRSTAAITSILLFPASGNFVAGSVCSLYGIV